MKTFTQKLNEILSLDEATVSKVQLRILKDLLYHLEIENMDSLQLTTGKGKPYDKRTIESLEKKKLIKFTDLREPYFFKGKIHSYTYFAKITDTGKQLLSKNGFISKDYDVYRGI